MERVSNYLISIELVLEFKSQDSRDYTRAKSIPILKGLQAGSGFDTQYAEPVQWD